jgi:phenylacetate-coenzyme A ligase PaaK-like adenylate-forming protein
MKHEAGLIDELKNIPIFSLNKREKKAIFIRLMDQLVRKHYSNCSEYKRILDILEYDFSISHDIESMPFIPARLFKLHLLSSINDSDIVKTLVSSGTSGQTPSTIVLDRENSLNQIRVLAKIISSITGKKRIPMLVIDSPSVLKDRDMFSARGAGILGFSMLATKVEYALNTNMELNIDALTEFSEKYQGEPTLIFGFTYMIWEYFYKAMSDSNKSINLEKAIMVHGGGWKKLIEQSVDNSSFKNEIKKVSGINSIYNYYGMVEQSGSIFIECDKGYLHTSIYSDVIMRRSDFTVCNTNENGIIQVISLLPTSYPGHSILTEDSGVIIGEDDCSCGRSGKYFFVTGRIKSAEVRGCSDTFKR